MLPKQECWVSSYRTLWMIVMFDLPVVEKRERKAATRFRNHLLDLGFSMAQYSVYYRLLPGKEKAESVERQIQSNLPETGKVQVLQITDKQYENIKTFTGRKSEAPEKPEQLALF